jgi:hypothetical protein
VESVDNSQTLHLDDSNAKIVLRNYPPITNEFPRTIVYNLSSTGLKRYLCVKKPSSSKRIVIDRVFVNSNTQTSLSCFYSKSNNSLLPDTNENYYAILGSLPLDKSRPSKDTFDNIINSALCPANRIDSSMNLFNTVVGGLCLDLQKAL